MRVRGVRFAALRYGMTMNNDTAVGKHVQMGGKIQDKKKYQERTDHVHGDESESALVMSILAEHYNSNSSSWPAK